MRRLGGIYEFFITLPDRFYPFAVMVEGKRTRGMRAYERAVARALKRNGAGKLGYKLTLYRETFHFAGSLLFIIFATLLSTRFFGSDTAVYVLLYAAIAALTFQEFYLHPKRYKQHFRKGLADWSFWVVPMLLYLYS